MCGARSQNKASRSSLYDRLVLQSPKRTLLVLLALFAFFAYGIKDFRLDASTDSLILEHDEDLRYYRDIVKRYETADFVIIIYTPAHDLFSSATLERIRKLREELRVMPRVSSVVSLLDVPLMKNPPGPLEDLSKNIKTLESPDSDTAMAIAEFSESPIYQELLVSPDLGSTALQVNFRTDAVFSELVSRRSDLLDRKSAGGFPPADRAELQVIEADYRAAKDRLREEVRQDIATIRTIIDRYRGEDQIFLGGIPMIADDIITFLRRDLRVFGAGMLCFLVLTLGVIFRRLRWVFLPMLCCATSAVFMVGILGHNRLDVTVVSSNFISLQLIFTMALAIHIVVRYRELVRREPGRENRALILAAVKATCVPCLYATLTTIAGFGSLVVCDILPVVNFGWMMIMGLCVSYIVTFLLLPACLVMMTKPPPDTGEGFGRPITSFFARITERHGVSIFGVGIAVAVVTIIGITRLEVENSFIDYFRESTEIYQGMKFVDQNLGGTTPLDVIISFERKEETVPVDVADDPDFDEFDDEFDDEFEEGGEDAWKYWFTESRLERISDAHDYFDALPEIGKVLSLATLLKTATDLNAGRSFDNFTLALLFTAIPEEFRSTIVEPYVSPEKNQARLMMRIKDSMPSLRRDALLKKMRNDLVDTLGFDPDQCRLTGTMVLYNNMLQSLFRSQIKTIGFTVAALMLMFMVLFRSLRIALIAIFPNLLSSMVVLGVMGIGRIPLDMMTITIVAISVGIAVDNTIHYLHRFRREIAVDGDYLKAMHRCHGSIGNAMFYTSLTITAGFSIVAFSNFIPTVLFGLLTALAMLMALGAALTLLPRLIMLFKPFGTAKGGEE